MKNLSRLVLPLVILTVLATFTDCSRKEQAVISPISGKDITYPLDADRTALGQLVAKGMANAEIRKIVKDEALKQFDRDYDVLLYQIKDQVLSTGQTIAQYMELLGDSEKSFGKLLEKMPLATIYVSKLPSFSAEKWDAANQVPFVAVLNSKNPGNVIKAFNKDNAWLELSLDKDPPIAVVVLKENERVGLSKKGDFIFSKEGKSFYYLDNEFKKKTPSASRQLFTSQIDPLLVEAYNKVKTCSYCDQRDYIYYGIFPPAGITEGKLNTKFAEAITDFRLENEAAFNNIGGWAEGNFEFYINAYFPNRDKPFLKVVSATADDLATYEEKEYDKWCVNLWPFGALYCEKGKYREFTGVKTFAPLDWPVKYQTFDMQTNGNEWWLKVFEFDPITTVTRESTREVTIGTNFKVDVSTGTSTKVGLGFGAERTEKRTVTEKYETTLESNQLGEAKVQWISPVLTDSWGERPSNNLFIPTIPKGYFTYQLTTGSVIFSFEVVRISQ